MIAYGIHCLLFFVKMGRYFLLTRNFFYSILVGTCLTPSFKVSSALLESKISLDKGFSKIRFISEADIDEFRIPKIQMHHKVKDFCKILAKEFKRYHWNPELCASVDWKADYQTREGHPLLYVSLGDGDNTTLILGGVHPDEYTPINLSFRFARFLAENSDTYRDKGIRVVVAPLVNPDGFIRQRPLRTNPSVDVNRNFLTLDWYEKALPMWRKRRKGSARYFPGHFPNTEIETIFQARLLREFRPSKILSAHAPLGFLDYDGPGDQRPKMTSETERKAREFVHAVARKSRNYRIVDYSFYPGSLGNFAGSERNIPTITLEMETTKPELTGKIWSKFFPGLIQSIEYPMELFSQ